VIVLSLYIQTSSFLIDVWLLVKPLGKNMAYIDYESRHPSPLNLYCPSVTLNDWHAVWTGKPPAVICREPMVIC